MTDGLPSRRAETCKTRRHSSLQVMALEGTDIGTSGGLAPGRTGMHGTSAERPRPPKQRAAATAVKQASSFPQVALIRTLKITQVDSCEVLNNYGHEYGNEKHTTDSHQSQNRDTWARGKRITHSGQEPGLSPALLEQVPKGTGLVPKDRPCPPWPLQQSLPSNGSVPARLASLRPSTVRTFCAKL